MNTVFHRSSITLLVALAILFIIAANMHRHVVLSRKATGTQESLTLPATAYSDLLNGLAVGGR